MTVRCKQRALVLLLLQWVLCWGVISTVAALQKSIPDSSFRCTDLTLVGALLCFIVLSLHDRMTTPTSWLFMTLGGAIAWAGIALYNVPLAFLSIIAACTALMASVILLDRTPLPFWVCIIVAGSIALILYTLGSSLNFIPSKDRGALWSRIMGCIMTVAFVVITMRDVSYDDGKALCAPYRQSSRYFFEMLGISVSPFTPVIV